MGIIKHIVSDIWDNVRIWLVLSLAKILRKLGLL